MKTRLLLLFLLVCSTKLSAQIGFDENIVTGNSYTTKSAQLVKAADIDGDNDLDIVAYGYGLNWYENVDGLGNFGEKKIIAGGTLGNSLYTVDFDNDGDIDILASADNKLTVYENTDGLGNFAVMQLFTLGASYPPLSAAPADMNGDGKMDIVCFYTNGGGAFQGWIVWYQNNGNGSFGPQQIITDSSGDLIYGSRIFIDDLDNDNDPDIILGYKDYNKIAWFKNTGNAVFNPAVIISTTAGGISYITTADVDNDGDKDILAAQQTDNQVVWYENLDGLGNFANEFVITSNATASYAALVTDVNNDNKNDVIYTGTNEIGWMGNADGSAHAFTSPQVITTKAYNVRSVIMADLDGDGMKDLVSASYDDDKVAWYKNLDGNGSFGRQVVIGRRVKNPNNVYTGDFDGDNDIDLLVNSQHDAKLTWFENVNGLGFYGKEHIITEDVGVGNITPIAYPADVDGDGDLDIVSTEDSVLFWYENDGHGNFDIEHVIDNTNVATIIRTADVDGDGDLDVVCAVYNADKISWYQNLGSGNFGPEQIIADTGDDNGAMTSLEIADMDGDGDMDIIASTFDWTVYYYKNTDGLGNFQLQNMSIFFDGMQAVCAADMDGDGDKDIVGVSSNGGGAFAAVVWYENNGQGNFTADHDVSTLTIHGQAIWAADIDNDGDMDVITAAGHEQTSGQLAWYPNNGDGTFAARQMIQELFNAGIGEAVTVADIDNDNDLDVVAIFNLWQSTTLGKVSVFENLGHLGNTVQGHVLIDIDGNGCTSADPKGDNLMVIADNGSHSFATFTDEHGAYSIATTDGSFTAAITSQLPDYFVSDPVSYAFNFSGLNGTQAANFCVAPVGQVNDLNVTVYPLNDVRPGFPARYRIVYRNIGTVVSNGTVNFQFDNSKMAFQVASVPVSSQTADVLSFNFTNLDLFETRTIDLDFGVFPLPAVHINDHVVSGVTVVSAAGSDVTEEDNSFSLNQTVIASYDPNDITCLEGNQVLIDDADKFLHYIIRFQNTGTAKAINVKVENTLDDKLDWTSMQLESLSHNGRVEITDGSDVKFVFDNINLPDSTSDEPHSHGFIAYKIKPKSNVVVGDIADNTADIFFDFNPPVVTNTASTKFVDELSVHESELGRFSMYPNPTTGLLNIDGNVMIDSVSVTDINGRTLKEFRFDAATVSARVDLSDLTAGIYFLRVKSARGVINRKIIKR